MSEPLLVTRVIARMNVGGPALQTVALARGLTEGFDHEVLVGDVEPGEADYLSLRAPDVQVVVVPGLGRAVRPLDDVRAFVALVRHLRRRRPHIVHTHTAKAGALGRVAAWLARVPVTVHTFHGHLLHGYFSPRRTRILVLVERVLAHRTTALVAVGERVRDELVGAGIGRPAQYAIVPPGVAPPARPDRAEARRELGLDDGAFVVAFVGRLTRVKRPDRLVDTAARILATRDDVVVVVAGGGDLLEETRASAATLGERIRFLGWRSDVGTLYAAADVVLLTSDNEGTPVSLIEAALCGCPAVATAVGATAEVVADGRTGDLVAADATALADAVLALAADPARRARYAADAPAHAEARFGERRLVDDTAALYRTLTHRGAAGGDGYGSGVPPTQQARA